MHMNIVELHKSIAAYASLKERTIILWSPKNRPVLEYTHQRQIKKIEPYAETYINLDSSITQFFDKLKKAEHEQGTQTLD